MNRHAVGAVRPYSRDLKHVWNEYRHCNPQVRIREIAARSLFGLSRPEEGVDPVGRDVVAFLSGGEEAA
jgi:hypothetical protein